MLDEIFYHVSYNTCALRNLVRSSLNFILSVQSGPFGPLRSEKYTQPSTDINCLTIDSQVCFHGRLFADCVKPSWCITRPTGPLGSTNQNWLCAKLLPIAVSIYPVVCVNSCRLLGTQHYSLCSNGSVCPPSACHPPPPTHPPTHPPPISAIRDITGPVKNSQKPAVNTARQS